jgi:hypothetical protein
MAVTDRRTHYSQGFFVLPLVLYFAWERRAALATAAPQPGVIGGVVILGALAVSLIGG